MQRQYLERHVARPFEVWSSLQGIEDSFASRFDRVFDQGGVRNHANKLNQIASEVCDEAAPNDLLLFLDGDAFPIADLEPLLAEKLSAAPLVAVQRSENLGDYQPHPCFCVTSVGTWLRIRGDWGAAATWKVSGLRYDSVTDVGGNLLRRLEVTHTEWIPLLRSNGHNLHPLFFGIYGDLVYHHGAGFRDPASRIDRELSEPTPIRTPSRRLTTTLRSRNYSKSLSRRMHRNEQISNELYARIASGDRSWIDELRGDAERQSAD